MEQASNAGHTVLLLLYSYTAINSKGDSDDEDELSDCQFPTETQDNLVKKADRDESKGGQSRSKSPATRQRNSARTKPKEST